MKDSKTVMLVDIEREARSRLIAPTERTRPDGGPVMWGKFDRYPAYLYELYDNVTTLHSVITGSVDIASGNAVECPVAPWRGRMNATGQTARDMVRRLAFDLLLYGGFALHVIRNRAGGIAEVEEIDLRNLRSDEDNEVFYYSEKWGRSLADAIAWPKYVPHFTAAEQPEGLYFFKDTARGVYPVPPYAAAVKACEMERCIDDYHLASIQNGFAGSVIVNFNNGETPTEDQKKEISRRMRDNYAGASNAGKMLFSWNPSKANATTIDSFPVQDFGEKYQALAKHSRQQIFNAFRCNGNIFGITTESLGFSSEEYDSAFRLYNRTQIRPIQRAIVDAFEYIFSAEGALRITPYSLDEDLNEGTL